MNTTEFYQTTLNFVDTTSKILKIAAAVAEKQAATEKAVAPKAAEAAQLLKSAELIDSHEVKRAEAQLRDPVKSLEVLRNVVDHFRGQLKSAEAKLASSSLGVAEMPATKTESGFKKNANYVGKRRGLGDGPSASDQALLRLLPGKGL